MTPASPERLRERRRLRNKREQLEKFQQLYQEAQDDYLRLLRQSAQQSTNFYKPHPYALG